MELIKPSSSIIPYDTNPLKHIELVARNCYKSEERITDESAPKFVKNLFERGHRAMLEFYPFYFYVDNTGANILMLINQSYEVNGDLIMIKVDTNCYQASCNLRTAIMLTKYYPKLGIAIINHYPELQFLFNVSMGNGTNDTIQLVKHIDLNLAYLTARFICDRGISHELVRHRKCSFAQESTRYCNYGKGEIKFIVPSHLTEDLKYDGIEVYFTKDCSEQTYVWMKAMRDCEQVYHEAIRIYNQSPQQARSVLPNSLKTEIIVQARLSEWKHIFEQRCAKAAHPDMQALMIPFKEEVIKVYPNYFTN